MLRLVGFWMIVLGVGFIIAEILSLMAVLPVKGGLYTFIFGQLSASIVTFGLGAILIILGIAART